MVLSIRRAAWVRAAPFTLFIALLALRGAAPADGSWGVDPRWIYGLGVVTVGGAMAWFWREYGELSAPTRPTTREALLAAAVGLLVFGLWINLDAPWMSLGPPSAGFTALTTAGTIDWPLAAVRWVGAALLVPAMEELFWRSFLMRWIQAPIFERVDPQRVGFKAIVLSTALFVVAHTLWLAAIAAGLAYAWLYVRSGKLWLPVIAHAVTNGALGAWVVATGRWQFW